ncbi:hypothetical protein B4Q13_22950, partial [Lacticaseibacillus rhamnosus]
WTQLVPLDGPCRVSRLISNRGAVDSAHQAVSQKTRKKSASKTVKKAVAKKSPTVSRRATKGRARASVKDTRTDPSLAPWRAEAIARGYASCVTLPLIAYGKRLGSLSLYAGEPNAFNERTIAQYSDLANNLAYGVTALRTQEESRRAGEALRESEQRLQDVVDNTTAVIFVKDLELRYVLVNRE